MSSPCLRNGLNQNRQFVQLGPCLSLFKCIWLIVEQSKILKKNETSVSSGLWNESTIEPSALVFWNVYSCSFWSLGWVGGDPYRLTDVDLWAVISKLDQDQSFAVFYFGELPYVIELEKIEGKSKCAVHSLHWTIVLLVSGNYVYLSRRILFVCPPSFRPSHIKICSVCVTQIDGRQPINRALFWQNKK